MSDGNDQSSPAAPVAVDRGRGIRPVDESWRADALAGSRHSRLLEELRQPEEIHSLERAKEICGEVARQALQDYAPALVLLGVQDRVRIQAITTYTLTLFDFVRQSGLEGERLSAINRWEFDLENALDGNPMGQPVFLLLADQERRRPWPRAGFDHLHSIARRRCASTRPADRRVAEEEALALATSLLWLVLGSEPPRPLAKVAAAWIRLRSLTDLGDDLRRHRSRLPVAELAEDWSSTGGEPTPAIAEPIAAECERLRGILESDDWLGHAPPELRRVARYLRAASLILLNKVQVLGAGIIGAPPSLGLLDRLVLLARCRWL